LPDEDKGEIQIQNGQRNVNINITDKNTDIERGHCTFRNQIIPDCAREEGEESMSVRSVNSSESQKPRINILNNDQ